ncbi:hypothetical protein [Streptomyces sedi]|uniref:Amino acid ABC transporter substrate-binding protein n=1 Tax=Streptomyces sedi TaxID=555059 RepID=A0A5C4UVR0_9ACTN|nr:hypothetical protein [Streptomyces sedi]TNM27761.1 hypothetical protein FH715_20375 [Streptomyces sedi]
MRPSTGRESWAKLRRRWNDLGWKTRRRLRAIGILLSLALVFAGGWGVVSLVLPDLTCDEDEGIVRKTEGGECVGVTDGSYVFADYLKESLDLVKAENERVERAWAEEEAPYVTVAFILPFTSPDAIEQQQMVSELQGAYLAQYRANREAERPGIRLVVGNTGEHSEQWSVVTDRLAELADSSQERLRVVTGLNVSTDETGAAVRELTRGHGIPVVVGPLTADGLENDAEGSYPGLARVIADNSDQAAALASFFGDIEPSRTLLVEDLREEDDYIGSLREVYQERTRDAAHAPETFRSPPNINDEGNLANEFQAMVNSICNMTDVDTVYFAGRNVQLRLFVNALVGRGCQDKEYQVITISGASTLITDEKLDWEGLESGGVTVRYTSNAHPDAWTSGEAPATGGSEEDFSRLRQLRDEVELTELDLSDSRAITMYDAVTTAVAGVRNSVTSESAIPPLDAVANAWSRMHGDPGNFIHGASGWICLDAYGRSYNKAVSIVRLDPAERGIRFEGLAWPTGAAPEANCPIPNARE